MCRSRVLRPAPTKPTRMGLSFMPVPPENTARMGPSAPRSRRSTMRQRRLRSLAVVAVVIVLAVVAGLPARRGDAQGPITSSLVDVSADLSSTRSVIDNYQQANPTKVKGVDFQRAPAPELPAKIKAQEDAGRVDVNLLLVGQDAGSVLANNGQLVKLFPEYDRLFPKDELTDAGKVLQSEGEGFLLPSVVSNGGPLFIYNPSEVEAPPKSAHALKARVEAQPAKLP